MSSNVNSKINFIHVGKSAGTSLLIALMKYEVDHEWLHCKNANEIILRKSLSDEYFLIPIRDPIERYISAFFYDYLIKYKKGLTGPGGLWREIYSEFENPSDLAEALTSPNPKLASLAASAFNASFLHIHLSLKWYVPQAIMYRFTKRNTFILDNNFLEDDLAEMLSRLGLGAEAIKLTRAREDYKDQLENYSAEMTDLAFKNLKSVLFEDYNVY
jgi:hypothetical protein